MQMKFLLKIQFFHMIYPRHFLDSIHGIAINPLQTISTGITFTTLSGSISIVLMTPQAAPIDKPTNPFLLATNPVSGSFTLGTTENICHLFQWAATHDVTKRSLISIPRNKFKQVFYHGFFIRKGLSLLFLE